MLYNIINYIYPIGNIIGGISTIVILAECIVKLCSFFTKKDILKPYLISIKKIV